MEYLWELLNKFPDLIRFTRLQDLAQDQEMKRWISVEVDKTLKIKFLDKIESSKGSSNINASFEQDFQDQFTQEEKKVRKQFDELFQEKTDLSLFAELQNILLSHISRIRSELVNELTDQVHQKKIKLYDIQGNETIREAAYKIRNQLDMNESQKDKYFEEIWTDIIQNLAKSYDEKEESKNLFQIVKENYDTNLITLKGVLPTTRFPLNTNISFNAYKQKLLHLVKEYYVEDKAFEYTKNAPALIFKGGKSNISFTYFDLKKYFEEKDVEELLGIPKAKVYEVFDISKLKDDFWQSSNSQEETIKIRLISKIEKELHDFGIIIDYSLLQRTLECKKCSILTRWLSADKVNQNEINHKVCQVIKIRDYYNINQYLYINAEKIKSKYSEWVISKNATFKTFFQHVLNDCIKWDEVINILKNEISEIHKKDRANEVAVKVKHDLEKLNLKFTHESNIQTHILSLYSKEPGAFKWEINDAISECSTSNHYRQRKDVLKQNFTYIKQEALENNLQRISTEARSQYLIVAKWKGRKLVVKEEFRNISWLDSYAKEETDKIFQNTTQNMTLHSFVFKEFNFESLVNNIFRNCVKEMEAIDNWTFNKLHQQVARETNNFIGIANNDLQQVSYRLDFKLVGHIHLSMIYLIWKFFVKKHWSKVTQSLTTMEKRKEQQKKFFFAVASSSQTQINIAESEKTIQFVQLYLEAALFLNFKKQTTADTAWKFQKNITRERVQGDIDSKYFSRGTTADSDDLYHYILNPYDVLLKFYEDLSSKYIQSVQTEIKQFKIIICNSLKYFLERIISVQTIITSFGEEFWSLHKVIEFTNFSEENEVLFKKYENELGLFYYRIVLALLKGDMKTLYHDYQINPKTKIIFKKINSLRILPETDEWATDMLNFLEQQAGRVTNALLFIKNLNDQVTQLIAKSSDLFTFKDEDIKEFQDKINVFICKQKCPCCDRICGIEEPSHRFHQCIYGHQIRGIGGTMLENKEASVARCEDIEDIDTMQYNGQVMTWMEFKEKWKNDSNNPWLFDDITSSRKDQAVKEKFHFAWTLIGRRICEVNHERSGMKYVEYNQVVIDRQKASTVRSNPKNYVYMIDSSSLFKILYYFNSIFRINEQQQQMA